MFYFLIYTFIKLTLVNAIINLKTLNFQIKSIQLNEIQNNKSFQKVFISYKNKTLLLDLQYDELKIFPIYLNTFENSTEFLCYMEIVKQKNVFHYSGFTAYYTNLYLIVESQFTDIYGNNASIMQSK